MRWTNLAAGPLVLAVVLYPACTPDVATDPLPEVLEFNPAAVPPRVSEPTFALISPTTGLIDLRAAGIVVPPDCHMQMAMPEAQCEFYQYLQSLDGFPTGTPARTPLSAPVDMATVTVPTNLAVVQVQGVVPALANDVTVDFDAVNGYLGVKPKVTWPSDAFVWIGVRGYANGIKTAAEPKNHYVASVPYNLLKRDESLFTCGDAPVSPALLDGKCKYFALLAQQMAPEAARASLVQLETLRGAMIAYKGWDLLAGVGIPKAEVAMLWGFRTHSGPVIELVPPALAPVAVAADELRLAVNGAVDPATVVAFQPTVQAGSVYLMNLGELAKNNLRDGFPMATATYAGGAISIKTAAPFTPGMYAIIVSNKVTGPTGKPMVSPPVSVMLKAHGAISLAGKSQVSTFSDADALNLELGREQLAALLDNATLGGLTGLTRANIAYLFAFPVGVP